MEKNILKNRNLMRKAALCLLSVLLFLILAFVLSLTGCRSFQDQQTKAIRSAAVYLAKEIPEPAAENSDAGWAVIAFSRLKKAGTLTDRETARIVPKNYSETYYDSARLSVKSGEFSNRFSPTDCARVTIALAVSGENPLSVEGQNMLEPLDQYTKVREQGLNAEIFALIAAGSCGKRLKNTGRYINDILGAQQEDGGIAPDPATAARNGGKSGPGTKNVREKSDIDISAMALQALSIRNHPGPNHKKAIRKANARIIRYLSEHQKGDGSYGNAESTAQVIIALSMCGRKPDAARDFIKNGHTLSDGLMLFKQKTGFSHTKGDEVNLIASEQALLALESIKLYETGRSVYNTGRN